MRSIWKYEIPAADYFELEMPRGADPLSVQVQRDVPCIWAAVDTEAPKEKKGFVVHGTGHRISDRAGTFIGTFQIYEGNLVFHLFEARP